MRFDFQPVTVHANRLANAFLAVNDKTALDNMDNFAVMRDSDSLGRIKRAENIFLVNNPARNTNDAFAVGGTHLRAGQADNRAVDFVAGGAFGLFDGAGNGV